MTTTPDTPTPDDRDPAGASALEDYEANTKDAPGAELDNEIAIVEHLAGHLKPARQHVMDGFEQLPRSVRFPRIRR